MFALERQRAGNKGQRQKIEEEGERERNKGRGRDICAKGTKDREETGAAHRQMAVYKGKRGNPVLG